LQLQLVLAGTLLVAESAFMDIFSDALKSSLSLLADAKVGLLGVTRIGSSGWILQADFWFEFWLCLWLCFWLLFLLLDWSCSVGFLPLLFSN
jgi:hypothetical protein